MSSANAAVAHCFITVYDTLVDTLFRAFATKEEDRVINRVSRSLRPGNYTSMGAVRDAGCTRVQRRQAAPNPLALYGKGFGIVFGAWAGGRHEVQTNTCRRGSEQNSLL